MGKGKGASTHKPTAKVTSLIDANHAPSVSYI